LLLRPQHYSCYGTPYPEVTGLTCRVPLPRLSCHILAFSATAPVLVLGTIIEGRSTFPFHGPLDLTGLPLRHSHVSPHNETPRVYRRQTPEGAQSIRRRQENGSPCGTYLYGTGILTGFPNFGLQDLPSSLGSPNPQLKNVAEESLPYKMFGILIRICCYLHQDIRNRPLHTTSPPCF